MRCSRSLYAIPCIALIKTARFFKTARFLLAVLAGLILAWQIADADDYPSRHITLIAPWPAAGAIDTLCRELAPGLGDRLGQPVVVENRPGAGSTIGTADGAKAKKLQAFIDAEMVRWGKVVKEAGLAGTE
jgi:tripartite-type tricarboxylate transporter receptor subunit TctC